MERRTRRAWLLVALAVTFVAVLGFAPKTALADGPVAKIGDTEYNTLADAVAAAPKDGTETTIQLVADACVSKTLQIPSSKNVTLDLAGYSVEVSSGMIQAQGVLTIRDSSPNGAGQVCGIESVISGGVLQANGTKAVLSLESGTVSSSKKTAVTVTTNGAVFRMTGGTIKSERPLNIQYGSAEIVGGSLISTGGTAVFMSEGAQGLTIGSADDVGPTLNGALELAEKVSSSAALNILSGGVPSITGAGTIPIGANIVIGFGSRADIAARIPSGLEIDEQDGKFYIKAKVTEETADVSVKHSDGSPVAYYQMDSTDTFDLRDGDTLTLLKSVNRQIDVKANGDVTIDLGGCSVTSSTDYALSVKQIAHNGNVTVKSSAPAKLSGTKAGISIDGLDMAAATLDYQSSNITLAPACIELGNARIPFNEANARLVTNGGFRTVVDGMPYIYGELSAAANEADANTEITLLNDYNGTEPMLVSSQGTVVVDLGGHTYTTSATCAAQIGMANVNATFKNGAIVSTSTNESANIVGVYLGSGGLANVNLTLDNVNLSMGHSGNAGVIVQGLNINNTVTLDGCKLTVPDDVMGIYFPPADSSLVINDTVINAGTGIGIKGGSLTVSGSSEIHAHGTNDQSDIPATGGIAETGAAIYVDDGYAANDNRNVTVTIKDGTFSSDKGSAIQELVSKPGSNPPVQIAVSGGSFDDTSIAGYLVPDAAVAVGADGSCTVYPSVEEARANGGGYQVVDKDGNTWFFSTPEAAAEFAKGQDDSAEVKEVLWTVTFDDCLDSTENQTVSVRNGEPVARPAEDPVCAGYRFLGWYSDKALTQAWDFGTPVHGDLTLYAKWEQVGGSTTTEKPAKPGSDTTTVDGGLAKTSDPTLVAPLAASALAGASALGVALGLRRRDR